jgi:predicted dithiol-disulfide oxidoreductase (DUF899 family)
MSRVARGGTCRRHGDIVAHNPAAPRTGHTAGPRASTTVWNTNIRWQPAAERMRTLVRSRQVVGAIGTREDWAAARGELLEREKEHTRMGDELARQRRELPWVPVEKQYTLQTADGPRSLAELFDGRSQLVVYHFMFGPDYEAGCPACSATADSFNGVLAHLKACDVTMICVSRAPMEKLLAYRERMGWSFNWASSHESDVNFDYGVSAGGDDARPSRATARGQRARASEAAERAAGRP